MTKEYTIPVRRDTPDGVGNKEQTKTRVLMCPSDWYDIRYEINPWMARRQPIDRDRAVAQWTRLRQVLEEDVGARVELVQPVDSLPDFVFTANAGLVVGDTFIPSRFRHPERAREERYWRAWFEARGYDVRELPAGLHFEGEGDVLPCGPGVLAVGFGFRSDREAVLRVGEMLELEVLPLELADPWFYHLDTCFCPVGDGTVLYYPGAFTHVGREAIASRFPDAIEVPPAEAMAFACNSVAAGGHVVLGADSPETRAVLEGRGYAVHEVDVGEFLKAGGGAKCMVLFIHRGTERASRGELGAAGLDARAPGSQPTGLD